MCEGIIIDTVDEIKKLDKVKADYHLQELKDIWIAEAEERGRRKVFDKMKELCSERYKSNCMKQCTFKMSETAFKYNGSLLKNKFCDIENCPLLKDK